MFYNLPAADKIFVPLLIALKVITLKVETFMRKFTSK